jgi:hypothetical protein
VGGVFFFLKINKIGKFFFFCFIFIFFFFFFFFFFFWIGSFRIEAQVHG